MITITDGTADFTYHPEAKSALDLCVSPQTCGTTKLSGGAYRFVSQKWPQLAPSEFLMIGDNIISDIAKAKEMGWKTILISSDLFYSSSVHADITVQSVSEILEAVTHFISFV